MVMTVPNHIPDLPRAGQAAWVGARFEEAHRVTRLRQVPGQSHAEQASADNAPMYALIHAATATIDSETMPCRAV